MRTPRHLARSAVAGLVAALCLAGGGSSATAAATAPGEPAQLGIKHVWLVNIENKSFDEAFVHNPNAYLSKDLPARGQLLTHYYGIGHLSLTNYIAQLSGQAPTLDTNSDCQIYRDVVPGTQGPAGQAVGQGCVYPRWVQTLPDQLDAKGLSWKGYMEDMGNDESRAPDRCGAPSNPSGAGFRDGSQTATATDQYAARHNPFVYFHSILDTSRCYDRVVPLPQLATDLRSAATTPAFSFVTPNLCNDGHDDPCVGKNVRGTSVGGLAAVDYWLQKWVPAITGSAAFKEGGLLVITADEADGDSSACCGEQSGYNTPAAGGGGITSPTVSTYPGGGRIGTVLIGRCVAAGTRNETPYNHYALLRSLEDVFGITTGGSDGKGHLGYAGAAGLKPFGADVFAGCPAGAATPTGAGPALPGGGRVAASESRGGLALTGGLGAPLAALGLVVAGLLAGRRARRSWWR